VQRGPRVPPLPSHSSPVAAITSSPRDVIPERALSDRDRRTQPESRRRRPGYGWRRTALTWPKSSRNKIGHPQSLLDGDVDAEAPRFNWAFPFRSLVWFELRACRGPREARRGPRKACAATAVATAGVPTERQHRHHLSICRRLGLPRLIEDSSSCSLSSCATSNPSTRPSRPVMAASCAPPRHGDTRDAMCHGAAADGAHGPISRGHECCSTSRAAWIAFSGRRVARDRTRSRRVRRPRIRTGARR
jgi:hypothetical protein